MIQVNQLSKRFGRKTVVDQLSFTVAPGEAVAFWGTNGAGKTTVIRCLLNLIPFTGVVNLAGYDVRTQGKESRRSVGFVPQDLNFHDQMSVAETVNFYSRLKKIPTSIDLTPLINRLKLEPYLAHKVGDLSGGWKQRLALALALLSDPPILILDEPTANLDLRARDDFLHLLHELKLAGKTILFSSHRLSEVTAVADRVLLLEGGRLLIDAPPHKLERELGLESTLHLYMNANSIDSALHLLTQQGLAVSRNGRGIRVQVMPKEKTDVLRHLLEAGITVSDFTLE